MIPIHDATASPIHQPLWPLLVAFTLLALLWVSPFALADDEYDGDYAEYGSAPEDVFEGAYEGTGGEYYGEYDEGYMPEAVYEDVSTEVIEYADPAAEQARQIEEEQAAKERAAAAAALKKRTDKLLSYLEKHHDVLEEAHAATKEAQNRAKASEKAMNKAASKVIKREQRIKKLSAKYKKLNAKGDQGEQANEILEKTFSASSWEQICALVDSFGVVSEKQAALLKEIRAEYGKLQALQRRLDKKTAQAEADQAAFEQAKGECDKLDAKAVKRIGAILNDAADDGTRRALGDSVAKSIFPEKKQLACPCPETRIEDGFGYRDFDGAVHKGIDYAASEGQPYYATADGVVIYATDDDGYNGGAGNWIVLAHGDGVVSKYMHSQRVFVKVGDIVLQGQHIANAGQTGAAYGPHLHFQVEVDGEAVDPAPLME